jgi:glycosyltransferase involved in cell wall biosynthesis
MPSVTVLMAVYNGELYLQEAIDSILNQTFQDFEFLIVNDGSTDRSRDIICAYNDPRIRLIDNENNLGLTPSLNKGWKLAQGEFIARQDADDISAPDRLAKQMAFLTAQPDIALVGTAYQEINAQGTFVSDGLLPCDATEIRWGLFFYCPFAHSAVMFRKRTVESQVGFYNESFSYAQDYDLWWRISRCLQVANIDDNLLQLRMNPSSMTATYGGVIDDEVTRIKLANIQHFIVAQQVQAWRDGARFRELTALWIGAFDELKSTHISVINDIISQILNLHSAFCRHYALDKTECQKHYIHMLRWLAQQLYLLACQVAKQDKSAAWQLLTKSWQMNRRGILSKRQMKLALNLLSGFDHKMG